MKAGLLKKRLKAKGAKLKRQGGNHEVWVSMNGKEFYVPRHPEINEITAKAILNQAEG